MGCARMLQAIPSALARCARSRLMLSSTATFRGLVDDSLRGIVQCYLKENKAIEEMYAQQDGGEQE